MINKLEKRLDELLLNTGDMALKRRAKKIILGLELKDGDKVLDVGCGDGYYLYLMSNLGLKIKITGTDFDLVGLKSAKQNISQSIKLVQADLMKKLPFKDNSFNKIVMSEVCEHLPNDLKGLKEVYRVIKSGGILCLTVPDANYPLLWDPVNWTLELLFKKHNTQGFWAGIWNQHIRLYKKSEIIKVVQKSRFNVLEAYPVTWWSLPFNHYIINSIARLLYGGKLSPQTALSISKYVKRAKRPALLNLAFYIVNLNDRFNNLYESREIGVSVFVKAKK